MPNWRDEYISSLRDSELQNPVNMELVQACSQMADRISALEAEKAALEAHAASAGLATAPAAPAAQGDPGGANPHITTNNSNGNGNGNGNSSDNSACGLDYYQMRTDLAEALRSKVSCETRLKTAEDELARLRARTKSDTRSIRDLKAERASLASRINDRDFELREKRKLMEQVQDELITLNLQVSMAEKERDKVKRENKELVDRWMKRMEQEADAMNLSNEPRSRHR